MYYNYHNMKLVIDKRKFSPKNEIMVWEFMTKGIDWKKLLESSIQLGGGGIKIGNSNSTLYGMERDELIYYISNNKT